MFSELEQARSPLYQAWVGIPEDTAMGGMQALRDETTGTSLAYVFDILPVGYLVVSTDTMITPIVAYSYKSDFSWEDVAENILLQMLKVDMRNRLQAVSQGLMDMQVMAENQILWDEYFKEKSADRILRDPTIYGPWLTTDWHQHPPYNDDCPMDPNTSVPCVVGCVATALSQILNYWQYPTSVTFTQSDSYTSQMDPNDGNGERTIPIDATTASFTGLYYNGCNPSDADKADLCFAAGVSVRMGYSSGGSGASTGRVAPALAGSHYPYSNPPPERWGYTSADLRSYNTSYDWWGSPYYTTEASFYDQLSANMQLARPAEMAITGSLGGHAIVVDGWQSGGRSYHLNFGWYGGSSTAWYTMPSGLPSGLDTIRYVVLNIIPTSTTQSLTVNTSGSGSGSVTKIPNQSIFTRGTHVLLTAVPDSGSTFDHWEGDLTGSTNPARIIMDGDKSVTAHFVQALPTQYTLTMVVDGGGSTTPPVGDHTYDEGTVVPLTATPDASWVFDHWSGDVTSSANPTSITMNGNKSVTSVFTTSTYSIDYVVAHWVNGDLDPNDPCQISLDQILQAIAWWANGTPVPYTGGQTIDLDKILDLIAKWATATCIDSSSTLGALPRFNDPSAETKSAPTATRSISLNSVAPGETFTVTVTVVIDENIIGLGLDEDLPSSWTVTPVNNDGAAYSALETAWLWLTTSAGETKTVVYEVTVPSDASPGPYNIDGVVKGASPSFEVAVGGDSTVTVSSPTCQHLIHELAPTGWHMIALPGEICGDCAEQGSEALCCTLCDDLDPCHLFHWQAGTGYLTAPPCASISYQMGMGVWVRTYDPLVMIEADLEVPSENVVIPLQDGWNQIGNPFPFSVPVDELQARCGGTELSLLDAQAQGWLCAYLFGYDTASGSYQVLNSTDGCLESWHGYWLRAYRDDCVLVVHPVECVGVSSAARSLSMEEIRIREIEPPPQPPVLPQFAGQMRVISIPNPVRDVHTVTFRVQGALALLVEAIRVQIFDLAGRLVYEKQEAGTSLDWHTDDSYGEYLANGIYLYKLYALVQEKWIVSEVRKLAILR
jgi:hypothetical protein